MKTKFKVYNKYEHHLLSDYYLTELMVVKSGFKPKKGLGDKFPIYSLLKEYLKDFGIYVFGQTELRNSITNQSTNIHVLYIKLDKNIPKENLEIISHLYGYEDVIVNIGLIDTDNYSINVDFYTSTKACILKKTVWCTDHYTIPLGSLEEAIKQSKMIIKK